MISYNGYINPDIELQMDEVVYVGDAGLGSDGIMTVAGGAESLPPDTYLEFDNKVFKTPNDLIEAVSKLICAKSCQIGVENDPRRGDSYIFRCRVGTLTLYVPPRREQLVPHRDMLVYCLKSDFGYTIDTTLLKTLLSLSTITGVIQ